MNTHSPVTGLVHSSYNPQTFCLQLTITGDLRSTTTPALHRDAFSILTQKYEIPPQISVVELDIKSATVVDSAGLNLVIAVVKWALQYNADARIIVGMRGVLAMMSAIGLDKHAQLIYHE